MRVTIIAVGRARADAPESRLFADYLSRLPWPVDLREVEERRRLPAAALRKREAELIRARLPKGTFMVALDSGGRALTSAAFAEQVRGWRDRGGADLTFIIGGAGGLASELVGSAGFVLSLGPMVWPHLLARAMLAEQLWRAHAILTGHPYHRG